MPVAKPANSPVKKAAVKPAAKKPATKTSVKKAVGEISETTLFEGKMQIGDHLVTPRLGYTHHGLYVGDDSVIHYSGFAHGISNGVIEVTSLESFCDGNEVHVRAYKSRKHSREKSVERAYSRVGEDWYNVLLNNCEQFVTWCITGQHSSSQVNNSVTAAGMAYVAAMKKTAPFLICDQGGIAGTKFVAGLAEKAGVSMLAKTTSATTVFESVAPALASSSLVSSTLGVGSGVAAGVGVSSAAGTAVGLVGVAGGGAVAAPVIVGVAVAYGVKKLFDWIRD